MILKPDSLKVRNRFIAEVYPQRHNSDQQLGRRLIYNHCTCKILSITRIYNGKFSLITFILCRKLHLLVSFHLV